MSVGERQPTNLAINTSAGECSNDKASEIYRLLPFFYSLITELSYSWRFQATNISCVTIMRYLLKRLFPFFPQIPGCFSEFFCSFLFALKEFYFHLNPSCVFTMQYFSSRYSSSLPPALRLMSFISFHSITSSPG